MPFTLRVLTGLVLFDTGIDLDLENGCRFENEAFALTFATADKVEGMTAFLQKRAANFKGE